MTRTILRTDRCGTDHVSIFVNHKSLDDKTSTKLLDCVLFGDSICYGNALGRCLKGCKETRAEEKCNPLRFWGSMSWYTRIRVSGASTLLAATDIVGADFEAVDTVRWRFAGSGVALMMVGLSECSSPSRLSLLDL
jgi:hypothetical protein